MRRVSYLILALAVASVAGGQPGFACDPVRTMLSGCEDPDPDPDPSGKPQVARGPEDRLWRQLNRERDQQGLEPLRRSKAATAIARHHARRMADEGKAYHNPGLSSPPTREELGRPATLGENVAVGESVGRVHEGFMRSAGHRANILGSAYDHVGIGVLSDGYSVYVVQVFLGEQGAWRPRVAPRGDRTGMGAVGARLPMLPDDGPPGRSVHALGPFTTIETTSAAVDTRGPIALAAMLLTVVGGGHLLARRR